MICRDIRTAKEVAQFLEEKHYNGREAVAFLERRSNNSKKGKNNKKKTQKQQRRNTSESKADLDLESGMSLEPWNSTTNQQIHYLNEASFPHAS